MSRLQTNMICTIQFLSFLPQYMMKTIFVLAGSSIIGNTFLLGETPSLVSEAACPVTEAAYPVSEAVFTFDLFLCLPQPYLGFH